MPCALCSTPYTLILYRYKKRKKKVPKKKKKVRCVLCSVPCALNSTPYSLILYRYKKRKKRYSKRKKNYTVFYALCPPRVCGKGSNILRTGSLCDGQPPKFKNLIFFNGVPWREPDKLSGIWKIRKILLPLPLGCGYSLCSA